jgi:hypothetical protein
MTVVALVATLGIAAFAAERWLPAADHRDSMTLTNDQDVDIADVYSFRSPADPSNLVLAMTVPGLVPPAETRSFGEDALYQFKIDNDGDAREDRVVQISFTGSGADQQVAVRGPVAPPVQGAMMNEIADVSADVSGAINTPLGTSTGLQVFAGPRDDPFFLDLEAFFCIVPDRKPVGGPLAAPCALPANPAAPFFFRNPGVNYIAGFNVLSIVVELPSALLENGAPGKLGIWGTISR